MRFSLGKVESPGSEAKGEVSNVSEVANTAPGKTESRPPLRPASNVQHVQSVAAPSAHTRVLAHKGVGITILFKEEPSQEVFEYLAKYCEFEKDNVPTRAELRAAKQPVERQEA
jgi:hypothetical protein